MGGGDGEWRLGGITLGWACSAIISELLEIESESDSEDSDDSDKVFFFWIWGVTTLRFSSSDEEESEEEEEEEGVALLFLFLLRFLAGFAGAIVVEFRDTAAFVTTTVLASISALPWLSEIVSANQYQCALLIAPTAKEAISSHLVPIIRHQTSWVTSQQPYSRLVLGTLRLGRLFFDDQVQIRQG